MAFLAECAIWMTLWGGSSNEKEVLSCPWQMVAQSGHLLLFEVKTKRK